MMTTVIKIPGSGPVQQIQIGPPDLTATIAIAHSIYGWLGGLRGVTSIFRLASIPAQEQKRKQVFPKALVSGLNCKILTSSGLACIPKELDRIEMAFGEDHASKLIGLTLCALSHELGLSRAIDMLIQYIVPALFREELRQMDGLSEALNVQLQDHGCAIVNEGAARGLPQRFIAAIGKLGPLGFNSKNSDDGAVLEGKERQSIPTDYYRIGGLLKWLGQDSTAPYFTQAAAVLRVAACLQEVGFLISRIGTWDGHSAQPRTPKGVFLTLGGSHKTDRMMDDPPYRFPIHILPSHYQFSTVGAMLLNTTLGASTQISPEAAQSMFETIFDSLRSRLRFHWKASDVSQSSTGLTRRSVILAVPEWLSEQPPGKHSRPFSTRLAGKAFPQSEKYLAGYYNELATEASVLEILKLHSKPFHDQELPLSLLRYRLITAMVAIGAVALIAGPDFLRTRHCTRLTLKNAAAGAGAYSSVDSLLSGGLSYSQVVSLVAYFHCEACAELELDDDEEPTSGWTGHSGNQYTGMKLIGWRSGNYLLLPRVLFAISQPISKASSLGFVCSNVFIANIPVHPNGTITSSAQGRLERDYCSTELFDRAQRAAQACAPVAPYGASPFIGPPSLQPPEIPLYFNIERAYDSTLPALALCGRVGGEAVGTVGVYALLFALVRSYSHYHQCDGQCVKHGSSVYHRPASRTVFNMPVSQRIAPSVPKPSTCGKMPIFIPVNGDPSWALFLLGQTCGVLHLGCIDCAFNATDVNLAVPTTADPVMNDQHIIGYE